jgi:hypothetical protein
VPLHRRPASVIEDRDKRDENCEEAGVRPKGKEDEADDAKLAQYVESRAFGRLREEENPEDPRHVSDLGGFFGGTIGIFNPWNSQIAQTIRGMASLVEPRQCTELCRIANEAAVR